VEMDVLCAPDTVPVSRDVVNAGDFVIFYAGYDMVYGVVLEHGKLLGNKTGNFHHSDAIGLRYGSKIKDHKSQKWIAVLKPTPELISLSMLHRTQILYEADIGLIIMLINAVPGKIIFESGTGSGSLSVSLARALSPNGHLHTFEYHEERWKKAIEEFKKYGYEDTISTYRRDVCRDGFFESSEAIVADGVFLDLPQPWDAIDHADAFLKDAGRIVTFSPCIEQVQRTVTRLLEKNYTDLRTFECIRRPFGVWADRSVSNKTNICIDDATSGANEFDSSDTMETSGENTLRDNGSTLEQPPRKKLKSKDEVIAPTSPLKEVVRDASEHQEQSKYNVSYTLPMRGHTGYITVATKSLTDELQQSL